MTGRRLAIERALRLHRPRVIPVRSLRCNLSPIAVAQGFGGEPIEAFPGYRAFRLYLEDEAAGRELFRDWYRERVFELETWRHGKERGGMATGSLAAAVARREREAGIPSRGLGRARREIVEAAIVERVDWYLGLLESIRRRGFLPSLEPPIACWKKGEAYVLINGHHRIAALHALGHHNVPVELERLHRLRLRIRSLRRGSRNSTVAGAASS